MALRGGGSSAVGVARAGAPAVNLRDSSQVGDTEALAVDVRGLVKSYSGAQAVRGIDLAIRHGRGLRAARPERGRQDHHDRDSRGLPGP